MSIPDRVVVPAVVFEDLMEGSAVMGDILELSIQECDDVFFVLCPYDLDGLDTPELGPYPTHEAASRAQVEIFASVTGSSA